MASISFVRQARALVALFFVSGLIVLAAGAAPASAGLGLACPASTTRPFTPWSDYANYVFAPDGGFESGASGWSLSGARVVAGNEPFFVHSGSDRYSLSVPAGKSATSPAMCISLLSSKMRFVAKGDTGAKVKVQIIYRGLLSNVLGILDGGTYSVGTSWKPSQEIGMLGGVLPLLTSSVSFRFTSMNGSVTLDDVYLDPMKSA